MPALDGLRILDMTQYEAGPSCTQILAWLGADVVKIEATRYGDPGRVLQGDSAGYSPYFCNWNANKRSVSLDLRKPEGRDLLLRMAPLAEPLPLLPPRLHPPPMRLPPRWTGS